MRKLCDEILSRRMKQSGVMRPLDEEAMRRNLKFFERMSVNE